MGIFSSLETFDKSAKSEYLARGYSVITPQRCHMKKYQLFVIFVIALVGCGGSSNEKPDFAGVWTGSYSTTSIQNGCPFTVNNDINAVFPMTVSIDANNVFTVVGGEGSVAVGGQGEGEVISFIASAPTFGNFGTTAPYTCATALATVGYLDAGTDKARVTMTYEFTDCAQAGSDDLISCGVIYYGEADKVG